MDEANCVHDLTLLYDLHKAFSRPSRGPPIRVEFSTLFKGMASYFTVDDRSACSSSRGYFWCPSNLLCLPVHLRCNGVDDCPDRQDEANCQNYTCPGFYRCRGSLICLHPQHVCDSETQCPQHDDEWFCGYRCPTNCSCQGLSYTCRHEFQVEKYPDVRYLNASGSGLTLAHLFNNFMLVYLSLEHCNLTRLHHQPLRNLNILDISHNDIEAVTLEYLDNVKNLKMLTLTGNPLAALFTSSAHSVGTFPKLKIMDLSMATIPYLNVSRLALFPGLMTLNLSGSAIQRVSGGGFNNPELRVLDMRGSGVADFPRNLLKKLRNLAALYVDNYKMCCLQSLPEGFDTKGCHSPSPVISSCDNLLGSKAQRIVVFLLAAATLFGNWTNFIIAMRRREENGMSNVFVPHLFLSKSVMGTYLAVINVADRVFSGVYLWRDTAWRSSYWCTMCGFLFLLSSQASVFVLVCMTLERCMVLAWADRGAHWGRKVKQLMCAVSWVGGIVLAAIPAASRRNAFSQTSFCIPLPVGQGQVSWHHYDFGVLVVLNTTLMMLTTAGQTYIYTTVHSNFMVYLVDNPRSHELIVARRLINLVVTDACCWFLFALWALLTSQGVFLFGDVTSVTAVFVTYVSSALTPYLYLQDMALERTRQLQRQRLLKRLGHRLTGPGDQHA